MELVLYARMPSGDVIDVAKYDGAEKFQKYSKEAIALNASFNATTDVDKVMTLFAGGASVSRKQIRKLRSVFRNFDEVYLCNEIADALGEVPRDAICVSLSSECSTDCVDLDNYDV